MTDHPSNGHQPVELAHVDTHAARAAERLAAQAQSLQGLLDDEDAVQARLREALDESKARQHALRRAVDALTPKVPEAAPKRGPGRPRRMTPAEYSAQWVPSQPLLDKVLRALVDGAEPITISALAESMQPGISRDTVRRAVNHLRDTGHIRMTGRTARGGVLYAAMPEELDDAGGDVGDGESALWGAAREGSAA